MIEIESPEAMVALGKKIATQLGAGDLIILNGPLGAGKTLLTKGIGEGLGISDIASPTFVIARTHEAPLPLIHVDIYRLLESGNAVAYLDDLDLDSPSSEAVTVIEWGGTEASRLNEERLEINIDRSEDTRKVSFNRIGARWQGFSL
jgi:tRNA threonylcarbamoyladenosine biosynthesis protein TsaE